LGHFLKVTLGLDTRAEVVVWYPSYGWTLALSQVDVGAWESYGWILSSQQPRCESLSDWVWNCESMPRVI